MARNPLTSWRCLTASCAFTREGRRVGVERKTRRGAIRTCFKCEAQTSTTPKLNRFVYHPFTKPTSNDVTRVMTSLVYSGSLQSRIAQLKRRFRSLFSLRRFHLGRKGSATTPSFNIDIILIFVDFRDALEMNEKWRKILQKSHPGSLFYYFLANRVHVRVSET